jgi:hypothetical protein
MNYFLKFSNLIQVLTQTGKGAYIHNEKSGQVEYQYIEKDGQRILTDFSNLYQTETVRMQKKGK